MNNSALKKTSERHPLAVIDIGSTALRMIIAEASKENRINILESLHQTVNLGKDTFSKGVISRQSMEECVDTLKSFQKVLKEYGIEKNEHLRVVATTAVREATNRDTFIDRVFIATGLAIEVLDDVDVSRLTYLSIASILDHKVFPKNTDLLVTEISGGATEVIWLHNHDVVLSKCFRLGALRLHEMSELYEATVSQQRKLMENDIDRTIDQIQQNITSSQSMVPVAIGGDMRFAAKLLIKDWNGVDPVKVPVTGLRTLTNKLLTLSVDQIVTTYHIPFTDAETIGPALLFYLHLAKAHNANFIIATDTSMRNGLLIEMNMRGIHGIQFKDQVINSALRLGTKYSFNKTHALHVASLCDELFEALVKEHHLDSWYRYILHIAALLHDIGTYVSPRSHHKHSMYLIMNSELFGLNAIDTKLIALIARYHRRSVPKLMHTDYMSLDKGNRLIVNKLAAILRVADALDRSAEQQARKIKCQVKEKKLLIKMLGVDDISVEEIGLQSKGTFFEDVYGMSVVLQPTP